MGRKSVGICFLLWLLGLGGVLGFHRMYVGRIGTGLLWMLTGGILGVGALVDLFCLGSMCHQANAERDMRQVQRAAAAYWR
ncbi:MAG TPA: TM2 domain-containing protein [Phycisphaerae bacterium]|nr:TM2 domain-containing protein [Phycisphaerae bacterium]